MSAPHRILFVCHGNICRSTNAFVIGSAATHDDEIGSPVHHGTRAVLEAQGIDCSGKTARRLRRADADEWDLFVGMDEANMRNMGRMLGGDPAGKLHKLLEFAGSTRDVADPWYTGDFDTTYEDVCDGCTGLLGYLRL